MCFQVRIRRVNPVAALNPEDVVDRALPPVFIIKLESRSFEQQAADPVRSPEAEAQKRQEVFVPVSPRIIQDPGKCAVVHIPDLRQLRIADLILFLQLIHCTFEILWKGFYENIYRIQFINLFLIEYSGS